MLKKNIRVCDLFDIYGSFLSEKQQRFIVEYFFLDNSLSEIATNFKVSRQAVLDSLSKSEKKLEDFEKQLSLLQVKKLVLGLDEKSYNKQTVQKLKSLF